MLSAYARTVRLSQATPPARVFGGLEMLASACAGAAAMLFLVFTVQALHTPAKPSTYDLVGIRSGEAYIIDTGLSSDDCAYYVGRGDDMRFDTVRCERSA